MVKKILFAEEEIQTRIQSLSREIANDYQGLELVIIGVLKGSFMFMADIVRLIDLPISCEFITVSSYGSSMESSGEVELKMDVSIPLQGKHVILIEDIIDSGLTVHFLRKLFQARNPASFKVCALLDKPSKRKIEASADYVGFTIEDHFVVGYGLDYAQKYRSLPYIGILALDK